MDARIWKPARQPRAVVQLMHGMAEHIDRYAPLAQALNEAGYLAAGLNHRGHGAQAERLGYFAPEKGWDCLVEDAHAFSLRLRAEYPGLPLILLGHSMGSFAAREYALRYGSYNDRGAHVKARHPVDDPHMGTMNSAPSQAGLIAT